MPPLQSSVDARGRMRIRPADGGRAVKFVPFFRVTVTPHAELVVIEFHGLDKVCQIEMSSREFSALGTLAWTQTKAFEYVNYGSTKETPNP